RGTPARRAHGVCSVRHRRLQTRGNRGVDGTRRRHLQGASAQGPPAVAGEVDDMSDETRTDEIRDEILRKAMESLPREIAPERDLWPGIAARIAPRRNRFRACSI